MLAIPTILKNPENPIYKLAEDEIFALKEANELILLEKYSYSLFAIWSCVVTNIQRRVESFGIEFFLNILEKDESFNKEATNLKDRWLKVNEYNLINYAKKINIINQLTHSLIITLFWMKSNTVDGEEKENMNKEEIFSIVYLLEKNLFLTAFKVDKRSKHRFMPENSNLKRRKKDKEELITAYRNTHQELLLKSGMKMFNENSKDSEDENKLIDTYM